jgi:hypothetical protein
VGPPSISVHGWEVCHRESQITVSSRCLVTFDQIVSVCIYTHTHTQNTHTVPPHHTRGDHLQLTDDISYIYITDLQRR